jgi:hypothetical protein
MVGNYYEVTGIFRLIVNCESIMMAKVEAIRELAQKDIEGHVIEVREVKINDTRAL